MQLSLHEMQINFNIWKVKYWRVGPLCWRKFNTNTLEHFKKYSNATFHCENGTYFPFILDSIKILHIKLSLRFTSLRWCYFTNVVPLWLSFMFEIPKSSTTFEHRTIVWISKSKMFNFWFSSKYVFAFPKALKYIFFYSNHFILFTFFAFIFQLKKNERQTIRSKKKFDSFLRMQIKQIKYE